MVLQMVLQTAAVLTKKMETIYHPLLQVTQDDIIRVQKLYNLDTKKINENLDAIEDWFKKQDHLVESLPYMSRDIIERFHILARGSVEQTKMTIDKVLTTKGLLTEFVLTNPNVLLKEFDMFLDNVLVTALPISPKDRTRVFLWRYLNENFEDFNIVTFAKLGSFVMEMRLRHDYIFSDRHIIDCKHLKPSLITKLNPVIVKRSEVICTEAYGVKVKGFHIINAPVFVDKILYVFKSIVKEKIINRIYIHNSYEELHEAIPKDVLPREYGGDLPSCSKFSEQMKNYLKTEEAKEIIENSSKIVSNETRRSCIRFNEEYLGMPGSFKRLNVD